jgi:stage II sporulation protein D
LSVPDRRPLRLRPHARATTATVLAVVGAMLVGGSFAAAAAPTPTPRVDPAPPPPTTITFYGRGYGHGVGMSQYGARGRALAGQDAATILAHYYRGTTPGATSPARAIRVLVLHAFRPTTAVPLRLYGRGGTWTIDGVAGTFPPGARLLVTRTSTGFRISVRSVAGVTLLSRSTAGDLRVRPTNPERGRIQVWSKPGSFDTYRGVIRIRASAGGIDAIDEVGLDAYLLGVVPAEMPSSWPVEALKAQAIASRSYAARRLHPKTGTWDLYDDTRSQVYRGSLAERPGTTAAVGATAGQVLRSGTAIANTLYHSTGGGATEDNENVFVSATGAIVAGPVSYLRGSADRAPDGTAYDAAAPRATWQTAAYTMDELSTIFAGDARTNVGSLTALDLTRVGVSGRLISVTLTGSLGAKTVAGDVFRSVFNSRSPAADPAMWSTLVSTEPIP